MPDLRCRYFDANKSHADYFKEVHSAGVLALRSRR